MTENQQDVSGGGASLPLTAQETPQRAFPLYQSHKKVRALKLKEVCPSPVTAQCTRFVPEDENYRPLDYADYTEVVKRCKASEMSDPGYLVLYINDGFVSWSPTEAFENGYTRLHEG